MSFLSKYKYIFLYAVALFAYLGLTNNLNVCHDEIFSLRLLGYSWGEMLSIIMAEDGHPPLFYILLRLWMSATDYTNVFVARLFPMMWVFALSLLGPFAVKRLFRSKIGFLYTFIVLCAPASFLLSTYIRMYAMGAFFVTASFLYANLIVQENKKSDWVKFFLFSLAGMYTHYLVTLCIGIVYGLLFLRLAFKYKKDIQIWKRFFTCVFLTTICFGPWLLVFFIQTQNMYDTWYPTKTDALRSLQYLFHHSFDTALLTTLYNVNTISFFNGALFFLIIVFFIHFLTAKKTPSDTMVFFPLLTVILTFLTALIISLTFRSILVPTYMILFLTPLYLIWAYLSTQNKAILITFLLLFMPLSATIYYLRTIVVHAPQYRLLQQEISKLPADTTITCTDANACFFLMFYAPQYKRQYYPVVEQLIVLKNEMQETPQSQAELIQNPTYLLTTIFNDELCPQPFFDLYYKRKNYCLYTPAEMHILLPHVPRHAGKQVR